MIAIVLIAAATCGSASSSRAADDAVQRTRLMNMLDAGDTGMIVQVFRRHPGQTLPFIDSFLESGLAMIEQGKDPAEALNSFRTGIRFAALADEAFGGTTFADYANSFASWSPTEQKSFREGQREYKAGVKAEDPKEALVHLRQSLALARPLGDAWGQAMAQQAMAEKLLALGDHEAAVAAASAAAELNSGLKLQSDAAESWLLAASASREPGVQRGVMGRLRQAWDIVNHDPTIDPKLRARVLDAYVASLEAAGMKEQAEELRREAEE